MSRLFSLIPSWRRVKLLLPPGLFAVAGVIATAGFFDFFNDLHRRELRQEFRSQARQQLNVFELNIKRSMDQLRSIHTYFLASEHVGPSESKLFVRQLVRKKTEFVTSFWIPRLSRRKAKGLGVDIPQSGSPDDPASSKRSAEVWPVMYVAGKSTTYEGTSWRSIDLLDHPKLARAARTSMSSKEPGFSPAFELDDIGDQTGLFAVQHVTGQFTISGGNGEQLTTDSGFVGLLVNLSNLFNASFRWYDPRGTEIFMFDHDGRLIEYFGENRPDAPVLTRAVVKSTRRGRNTYSTSVSIGNRSLKFMAYPGSSMHSSPVPVRSWLVLIGGLLFSILGPGYLYNVLSTARRHEIQATRDSLTELFNRRHFFRALDREIVRTERYRRPLSLLILDLDHFKKINDRHGHRAGDRVLIKLGEVIRENTRDVDIPARYGGEEFVVLFPETDLEDAVRVGNRIRTSFANCTHTFDGDPLTVTCSGGVSCYRGRTEGAPDVLIDRADNALYAAKKRGRNRIVSEEQLRDASEKDDGAS